MGKNILLLGASQVASHILTRLMLNFEDPHTVTVLDRKPPDIIFLNTDTAKYEGSENIKLKQLSMWDFEDYLLDKDRKDQKFDVIINALNVHDVKYSLDNPVDTNMTNVIFTSKFMHTLQKLDFNGKLIHVSTDKVYGFVPESELPIKEDKVIPNPVSIRAGSRYAQEIITSSMAKLYGIPYIILRFGTTFGSFMPDEKAISRWCIQLLQGENAEVYGPEVNHSNVRKGCSRDFVHIYDATMAIKNIIDKYSDNKTSWNEVYNIGGQHRYERFVANIAESLKSMLKPVSPTAKIVYGPWRDVTEEKILRLWLDCHKAEQKIGYTCDKDIVYGASRDVATWIAQYRLGWDNRQMLELERGLGILDEGRKAAAALEAKRKDTGVSPEVSGTIGRLASQVG